MLGLESVSGRRQAPGGEVGAVPGGGTRRPENWLELGGRVSLWGPSPQDTGRRSPCKEGRACRAENGPALAGTCRQGDRAGPLSRCRRAEVGLGRELGGGLPPRRPLVRRPRHRPLWFQPEDTWRTPSGRGGILSSFPSSSCRKRLSSTLTTPMVSAGLQPCPLRPGELGREELGSAHWP